MDGIAREARLVVLWGVGVARGGLAARIFVPSALNPMRLAALQIARKRSIDFAEVPPHKTPQIPTARAQPIVFRDQYGATALGESVPSGKGGGL